MKKTGKTVKLAEQHIIGRKDSRFAVIDGACFKSKNLYNSVNYIIRQAFFKDCAIPGWGEIHRELKDHEVYKALPAKVSNMTIIQVSREWKSYFAALKEWKNRPESFNGKPRFPGYKDKEKGRNILYYDIQAISRKYLRQGIIKPSKLDIEIPVRHESVRQLQIVPRRTHYAVFAVYEKEPVRAADLNYDLFAGADIGLNNLATVVSNRQGFVPLVFNGRHIKSINQFYNKERARLAGELEKGGKTSDRLERLTDKRNRKIRHELHNISRQITDILVSGKIGNLIIGKNKGWKQKINIGKRNNQNFVSVPHAEFADQLVYKGALVGINVVLNEESYTSKCSFLDHEPVEKHEKYAGRRIKRGLFRAGGGILVNADVNGAYNIIIKAVPEAFADGIEGVAVHPVRVS